MSIDMIKTSGLLELYVAGEVSQEERLIVENAMEENDSIKYEILEIEKSIEAYVSAHAIAVDPTARPMLLAAVDFSDRLQNGEVPINPPSLSATSKVSDFKQWLEREDLQEHSSYDSMCGKIINTDDEKTTMIIWLKDGAPDETHTDELEKFLVVEGTCDITIGETVHSLKSGDFLAIPLFVNHNVKVTSSIRCKIILERAAA